MANMISSKEKPVDLQIRTLDFSKNIIRFCKNIKQSRLTQPIINQLIRSATSIGANFTEAKNAGSVKDFRNKVYISKKEAAETLYWLDLLSECIDDKQIDLLQNECKEIVLILQSIVNRINKDN